MFYSNYSEFLDKVFLGLDELKVDVSDLRLDHLAYQVATNEEYDRLRPELLEEAELIKEPLVDGRRVGVFKFRQQLKYKDREIETIELIAPTEGKSPESGLEHAEFLLNESFEDFIKRYPEIGLDDSNANREQFPMLKLRLSNGLRVKFPKYPILSDR